MKWLKFFSFSIILVFASAFIIPTSHAKENSLKEGKWALQFAIGRDFDVKGFQGQTLSIKNHTADNRAYRLGITVALEESDGETERRNAGYNSRPSSTDVNSRRIDFNLQKIYYTDVSAPVNVFYGLGVATSFAHSKNRYERFLLWETEVECVSQINVIDSWSAGMSGIFGAEWFFATNMSLLGEYSTVVNYGSETRQERYTRINNGTVIESYSLKDKRNSFKISASAVNLGLSFYF